MVTRPPSDEVRGAEGAAPVHLIGAASDAPDHGVCSDAESRALLVPYALARCQEADAERFEAHMLGCGGCFEDLKSLDRAGTILREYLGDESPSREAPSLEAPSLEAMRSSLQHGRVPHASDTRRWWRA